MNPPNSPEAPREALFPKMEEEISAYWKKHKIFERSIEERPESKGYVVYDGPPFATGLPHYGHLLQSTIKDVVPRYWTMKGYRVPRKWGWDCHGLPIENLIEKDLKLVSKKEIEAYGIDKFNAACRLSVFAYVKEWAKYVDRLGRWVDFENSYKTIDDHYIESVWWVFSELYKKELVYKDVRVSLYCPRCATPLSNFEIAMGNSYVDHTDPAIMVKFPVVGEEKTFFLAWTTTPWTLPANTGLAVHSDLTYVAAKLADKDETLIFAEARKEEVLKDHPGATVVRSMKGSELVGKTYEPLFSFLPVEGKGFRVVSGSHVTADDGTGIVHTAPAFGEDDLRMAREHGLPIVQTVDEEGRLVSECGPFGGLKVKEADRPAIENLTERGLLYREEQIVHSVPVCWRCNTLLLFKAQPAWFVNVTKLKPDLLKTAKKINWHPEHLKDGRFGKGLETAPDWNISRTRYWGSPMPVWQCGSCEKRTVVGSIAELKSLAKLETWPETVDMHRPGIDAIVLPCSCGGEMRRIVDVFDCWFESGSMPVAMLHYPFENKKWFEQHFPADFIAEAQDQTRGWFYTLHVLGTALFEKPAFTNVTVTGLIMAEDGKKMSKSLKNYPDPWKILTTQGADALRYYFLSSPVIEADNLNFSERDLETIVRGFLNLVWNVKTFYAMAATTKVELTMPRSAHILDRWLFSRFTQLLEEVTTHMDQYEISKAARPLRAFVDDLSTWWLRRSRDRLKSENEFERMDALRTLREILEEFAKIMAPFMPFIAEKIYLEIGGQKASVHLENWPKIQERMRDERLMSDMRWVREVVSKGHEARVAAKMAVRQALASCTITLKDGELVERLKSQADLLGLMREELNVEAIYLELKTEQTEPWTVALDTVLTPELKQKGLYREFTRSVMNLRKSAGLQPLDRINLSYRSSSSDVTQMVTAFADALKKELRADAMQSVATAPEASRAHEEAKIGGQVCELWLV